MPPSDPASTRGTGPYRPEDVPLGESVELAEGYLIQCMTTGGRGGRANALGASVLDSDPKVEQTGVDTGFILAATAVRAPDIAVGNVPNEPGLVRGAPPLAVEIADTGQDEAQLQEKIRELHAAGTQQVWVVRLVGPRRVEVYENGKPMVQRLPGEVLAAPGILENPVPVMALYDRDAAHEHTLRNLLNRKGFASLDAVIDAGKKLGVDAGKKLGIDEGKKLGIDEGRRELVGRMLERGFSVEDVARMTGLDPAEILRLKG